MSTLEVPDHEQKREENLDRLYELRKDLHIIADSDARYSEYAQNALETLQEEGYDV